MKNTSKVFGIIHIKNEWPLFALSISHALMHHVDDVFVLNHASTDLSSEGLQQLKALWKDRIHIFNCPEERYEQEVFINSLITICQTSSPDWIFVFDADEFIMTNELNSLKSILSDVDPKFSSIRYDVENWISTEGFDESNLEQYRMLQYRSIPNLFLKMYPNVYVDEILNGNLNFFDTPFPSKVIVRNDMALWLAAGSHSIRYPLQSDTFDALSDVLRVVHFPLLSRKKLHRKVNHGQRLIRDGFPSTHGWQSQMIYKFSQMNELDGFWSSHSIGSNTATIKRTLPSFTIDDSFIQAIEPTLCFLEKYFNSKLLFSGAVQKPSTRESLDSLITFGAVLQASRSQQLMLIERDKAFAERDKAFAERDKALAERDKALADRDLIVNSITWRYTDFIRRISNKYQILK